MYYYVFREHRMVEGTCTIMVIVAENGPGNLSSNP